MKALSSSEARPARVPPLIAWSFSTLPTAPLSGLKTSTLSCQASGHVLVLCTTQITSQSSFSVRARARLQWPNCHNCYDAGGDDETGTILADGWKLDLTDEASITKGWEAMPPMQEPRVMFGMVTDSPIRKTHISHVSHAFGAHSFMFSML